MVCIMINSVYCSNSSNVGPSLPDAGDGNAATVSKQTSEHQLPSAKKRTSGKSKADEIDKAI